MKYVLGFILSAFAMLSRAWSASLLWGWFIAGPFSLPTIGILTAAGISYFVFALTFDPTVKREKSEDVGITFSIAVIVGSLVTAGCGWIAFWLFGGGVA